MMAVARQNRPSARVSVIHKVFKGPTSAFGLCTPISWYGTMTALTMTAKAAASGRIQSPRAAVSLSARRSTSARNSLNSDEGSDASHARCRSLR